MATIPAASAELSAVQSAIASASNGDTVTIPAGEATWTSQLTVTKQVSLIGAGESSTIITSGFTTTWGGTDDVLLLYSYTPAVAGVANTYRLSGITFDCAGRTSGLGFVGGANPLYIRIDHVTIQNMGTAQRDVLDFWGHVWGVIDHCTINKNDSSDGACMRIFISGMDDLDWSSYPFEYGTEDALIFEDCTLYFSSGYFEHQSGARSVVRHCTLNNSWGSGTGSSAMWQMWDMHGNYDWGRWSTQGCEVYDNEINADYCYQLQMAGIRGGKALFYNNDISHSRGYDYAQVREENVSGTGGGQDGHDSSQGPPVVQAQNGQTQHVSETYMWNITLNGVSRVNNPYPSYGWPSCSDTINYADTGYPSYDATYASWGVVPRENVHFFQHVSPFTGSAGMGVGLRSARPATCTTEGVAYWATNESTLYRWHSGAWQTYYTPYTYPHPLVGGASPQTEFYVDRTAGNDSNPGTLALPWLTLTKANSTLVAGDTCYVRGGTYSTYIEPANSGTAIAHITYRNYGSETVTIQNCAHAISLDGKSYIDVTGINFYNCDGFLWMQNSATHNTVSYCNFDAMRTYANWAGSRIWRSSQYNWVHHCRFSQWGYGTGTPPSGTPYGCVFEIGDENTTGDLTERNTVEDNTMYWGVHHVIGVNGRYNVVRNNDCHNEGWHNGRGNRTLCMTGSEVNSSWNLIEGNRFGYTAASYDSDWKSGALLATSHNIVRKNAFFFNNLAGLQMSCTGSYLEDVDGNHVYNNTFFRNGQYSGSDQGKVAIYMANWSGGMWTIEDNCFKNNLYYGNPGTYAYDGVSAGGQTYANEFIGETSGNPLFVSATSTPGDPTDLDYPDLRLLPGSPALNAGGGLTTITSASGSGVSFVVADAAYFTDGWGAPNATGDLIRIVGTSQTATITNVNYSTNTITVASSLTWTQGQSIALDYPGTAPNAGAYDGTTGTVSVVAIVWEYSAATGSASIIRSAAASDYLENALIDHVFRTATYTSPAHIYIALCKSTVDDAHTGSTLPSEVSGGGYARALCDGWSEVSSGETFNTNENTLVFATATADWGRITDLAICDAQTGGNVLTYGKLYNYKDVEVGDIMEFEAGGITVSLD